MNARAASTAKVLHRISRDEGLKSVCRSWVVDEMLDHDQLAGRLKERITPLLPWDESASAEHERDLFVPKLKDMGDALELVNWSDLAEDIRRVVC